MMNPVAISAGKETIFSLRMDFVLTERLFRLQVAISGGIFFTDDTVRNGIGPPSDFFEKTLREDLGLPARHVPRHNLERKLKVFAMDAGPPVLPGVLGRGAPTKPPSDKTIRENL